MTIEEVRAKLAAKGTLQIEHEGMLLDVREPSIGESISFASLGAGIAREAAIVSILVSFGGEAVFKGPSEVIDLGIRATILIEKVKAALKTFASYGIPAAAESAESAESAVPEDRAAAILAIVDESPAGE